MILIVPQSIDCFYEIKEYRKYDLFRDKLNAEFESSIGCFSGITSCFLSDWPFSRLASSNNSKPAATLTDAWAFAYV